MLALESLSCRRNTAFSQATTVVLGRHPNDDADAICHPPIGNYPTRTSHQLSRQALGGKITERILAILESRLELFPPVLLLQALTKESSSLAFCCSDIFPLHDLPIGILSYAKVGRPPYFTITVFLTLNGLLVVLSEKFGFRLTRVPAGMRWLIHVAILVACYLAALHLTTWIAIG